jgi:hypothetical protein
MTFEHYSATATIKYNFMIISQARTAGRGLLKLTQDVLKRHGNTIRIANDIIRLNTILEVITVLLRHPYLFLIFWCHIKC